MVVGAIAISLAGILVRLSEVGPAATGFYRFLFALPLLWLWMSAANRRRNRERGGPPDGRAFRLIALGGLFLGLDLVVWNWAIHLSSVSNATLLGNAAPIWVALAGWLFFRERFTGSFLGGLALAIVGIGLLLGGSFSLSIYHAVGDMLGVVAGALWGAYIMTIGRLRGRVPIATIMFWGSLVSCPVLLVAALLLGEEMWPHSGNGWLDLLSGALCQVADRACGLGAGSSALLLRRRGAAGQSGVGDYSGLGDPQRTRRSPADRRWHHRTDRHPAGARPRPRTRTCARPIANTAHGVSNLPPATSCAACSRRRSRRRSRARVPPHLPGRKGALSSSAPARRRQDGARVEDH